MIIQMVATAIVMFLSFATGLMLVVAHHAFRQRSPLASAISTAFTILPGALSVSAAMHYPWVVSSGVGLGVYVMMRAIYGTPKDNRSDLR